MDLRTIYVFKDLFQNDMAMLIMAFIILAENIAFYFLVYLYFKHRWAKEEESRLPERTKVIIAQYRLKIKYLQKKLNQATKRNEILTRDLTATRAWARTIQHRMTVAVDQLVKISEGLT